VPWLASAAKETTLFPARVVSLTLPLQNINQRLTFLLCFDLDLERRRSPVSLVSDERDERLGERRRQARIKVEILRRRVSTPRGAKEGKNQTNQRDLPGTAITQQRPPIPGRFVLFHLQQTFTNASARELATKTRSAVT
jgi:hypothetical protein